ncbi:winged helix-turn-helix transcriptional regulator [Streptomyces caatingaensis]|uniref:ArsR family transcriptional regulator n=1 Tax=Streptomyces caatingaensis TaxID=1678637 RepID=A0A0K9XLY5_9ACTN|nr:winged helix-turn-helix transcriptional regulator [Streptomyces caatingaensis]KNB54116.1 ArsR family transcriptional regulator [Streptomyces caatingaensis]
MTEEDLTAPPAGPHDGLPDHAVRTALLELLAEVGTVTATEAAARLGHSSGLCSFHLRQLARHGYVEEAPRDGGRARPWRLTQRTPGARALPDDGFGDLARGLEDESWRRWLDRRDQAPVAWRHDEAFSAIAYLTPEEMTRVADAIRRVLAPYRDREHRPLARPEGALPVALISRLFPLLPHSAEGDAGAGDSGARGGGAGGGGAGGGASDGGGADGA